VFGGHDSVARLLLEDYRVGIEAKDLYGRMVLHWATLGRNMVVVRLLLEDYKADVEANNFGQTALFLGRHLKSAEQNQYFLPHHRAFYIVLVLALSGQVELLSSRRDSRKFYYVASLH
jgi:hypothetical protein